MTYHEINTVLMFFCIIAFMASNIVELLINLVTRFFKLPKRIDIEELELSLTIILSIILADIVMPAIL